MPRPPDDAPPPLPADRPTPRALALAGAVLVALVLVGALLLPAGPTAADQRVLDAMDAMRGAAPDAVAHVMNRLGSGIVPVLATIALGVVLALVRGLVSSAAFLLAEAVSPLASHALKAAVDRPRPAGRLLDPFGSSFPSGHATYAATTAVALVLLLVPPGRPRRLAWAAAGVAIVLMAWSRAYLRVHWLTDVTAGAALGAGVALLAIAAVRALAARRGIADRPLRPRAADR